MKTLVALAVALSAAFVVTPALAANNNAARPGPAAPQAAPGDLGMAIMSAVVNADGTLARGEGATASTLLFTGNFQVNFGRDVTACTYVASTGLSETFGDPLPAYATVVRRNFDPNALYISTFDSVGDSAPFGFHVVVYCGR